jgi:hypothetical protein
VEYFVIETKGHRILLPDGEILDEDTVSLAMENRICLEEIETNLYDANDIRLKINEHLLKLGEVRKLGTLCTLEGGNSHPAQIRKGTLVLGKVFIHTPNSTGHSTDRSF